HQTDALHSGLAAPALVLAAAREISAPVLFHMQWDDEVFPREGQFDLFDALASADKLLLARSGPHAATCPDDEAAWQEFLDHNATATPGATRVVVRDHRQDVGPCRPAALPGTLGAYR